MPLYRITRTDVYIVTVEAKNLRHAQEKIDGENEYLNSGSYAGSVFTDLERITKH